jgi:hypothetical protein
LGEGILREVRGGTAEDLAGCDDFAPSVVRSLTQPDDPGGSVALAVPSGVLEHPLGDCGNCQWAA